MQDILTTLKIGNIVQGRYKVEKLLGKGGFGAVYLVRDLRVSGNVFALKEVVDPNKKEREHFTFEGEVLKRLDYPSLPRVYRTFEDDKLARAYILMDYIDGSNLEVLRQKQPEKRFPVDYVLRVMEPIMGAVSFLHRQNPPIVHRDIKPSNIIVPAADDAAAVLVDFGIAKEYDAEATTTAIRRCSPGYGAPEQYAKGTNPATDIYGLAATCYALLTGVVPTDALYRITQLSSKRRDPLEPVTTFVPGIPKSISDAILRGMAVQSKDRFASVEEFWAAMQYQAPQGEATTEPVGPVVMPAVGSMPSQALAANEALAVENMPTRRITSSPRRKRRRSPLAILLAFLAVFAILTGVIFGSGLIPLLRHLGQKQVSPTQAAYQTTATARSATGATATVAAKASATTVVKPTPTPVPKATPTATPTAAPQPTPTKAQPTPVPTAQPTPAPTAAPGGNYPVLTPDYSGTISDKYTNPPTNASLDLSNIQQNNGAINGNFHVGSGLVASDTFSGTVTTDNKVQFTVPSYNGLAPLLFNGQIQSDGRIVGTYCSVRNNQCDQNAGGWGDWQVSPQGTGS